MTPRHRLLPKFLTPREIVVVASLARGGSFVPGRQGTGYDKRDLLDVPGAARLVGRCVTALGSPAHVDAWLLRYPVGSEIPAHTDPPLAGLCHVRINVLAVGGDPAGGGALSLAGVEVPLALGDAYLFRPDTVAHAVSRVARYERLVLSVGANVDEAHAAALGLG